MGFTLIELLVVLAIIATLLSIAVPRYFGHVDSAKEASLRQTLAVTRDALDKYHADVGRYPDSLEDLVAKHYLRKLPEDPVAGKTDSWRLLAPPPNSDPGAIHDLKSGAPGTARDGSQFGDW
jgi:general secretion pathway protein G